MFYLQTLLIGALSLLIFHPCADGHAEASAKASAKASDRAPHRALFTSSARVSAKREVSSDGADTPPFELPPHWRDARGALPRAKALFIGPPSQGFHPSINLTTEESDLSLEEYIDAVGKGYCREGLAERWQDLGRMETRSGEARLASLDVASPWGTLRLLQLFLAQKGRVYIVTASSLKRDFSAMSALFQGVFRSFEVPPEAQLGP